MPPLSTQLLLQAKQTKQDKDRVATTTTHNAVGDDGVLIKTLAKEKDNSFAVA
jgi:hypothetical protein